MMQGQQLSHLSCAQAPLQPPCLTWEAFGSRKGLSASVSSFSVANQDFLLQSTTCCPCSSASTIQAAQHSKATSRQEHGQRGQLLPPALMLSDDLMALMLLNCVSEESHSLSAASGTHIIAKY